MEGQFSRQEIPWNQTGKKAIDYPEVLASSLRHNSPVANTLMASSVSEIQRVTNNQLRYRETEIASIDAQIMALQQRRGDLVKEATPGWMTLDACKTVLAPIRRIPSEILQEIALHALPVQPHLTLNEAPMSLLGVCRDWRNALLSLPQAWSDLYLEIDLATLHRRRPQAALKNWFDRAKNQPLSLYLHFDNEATHKDIDSFSSSIDTFLNDISSYFYHLRHLGLSADLVLNYFRFFGQSGIWRFRDLHTFTLNLNKRISNSDYALYVLNSIDDSDNILAFQTLPSLRKLCLDEPISFQGPGKRMFPWGQLTDLCLSKSISLTTWRRLLELCPQLRKGDFALGGEEEEDLEEDSSTEDSSPDADPGPFSNMEDLQIFIYDEEISIKKCFATCRFPHLRILHLIHGDEFTNDDPEWKGDFPQELSSIQTLAVGGDWSKSPECLDRLLVASSSVSHLAVMVDLDIAIILKMLTHSGDSSDSSDSSDDEGFEEDLDRWWDPLKGHRFILPNLSDLTLVLASCTDEEDEEISRILKTMERMLESRTSERVDSSQCLKRFRVLRDGDLWGEGPSRRIQACLDKYHSSGLDFELTGCVLAETSCSSTEWKGGLEQRMSMRALARAEGRARDVRRNNGVDPSRPLPGGSFPGFLTR